MSDWIPPETATPVIVCAACKYDDYIFCSPRHLDGISRKMIVRVLGSNVLWSSFSQGFVDQWGRFYSREHAWDIVQWNGQPFNQERNAVIGELYSEGLY